MDQRIREHGDDRTQLFADLYAAYYRPLVAFCHRLTSGSDGEELAQEAFLRAWSSWDRYAPSRPFWPWVSTIARRLCIDHGRRLRTAQERGPWALDGRVSAVPTPDELLEASEEYRWARAALAQLRPDQRRVIRLRDVEGWSYDRIADHEGVTVESVRGSLRRARSRLRLVYAQMSSGSAVVVILVVLRDLRRRAAEISHRVQAANAGVLGARAADAVAALVVLAMGATAPVTAGGPAAVAAAAAANPGGVVTATSAPAGTTTSSTGPTDARVRDGASPDTTSVPGRGPTGGLTGKANPLGGLSTDVPGSGDSAPEGATFMSFTASPNYQRDHQVYASGFSFQHCAATCPALFRSDDGGATWTRLPAIGFEGGVVMLPPSYPADSRVFVGGPNALKVSSDGGQVFTPLTPAGGYTAMSPAFSAGDGRILVGAIPGWIYHDDTKAVTPFDAVPESTSAALSFAYASAYPRDHRIVIGGTDASPNQNAIVSACDGSNCTPPAALAGSTGTPAVMTAKSYSRSGLAFAWTPQGLYRSTDAGSSFSPLRMPAHGQVQGLVDDGRGNLFLAVLDNDGRGGTSGGLFASRDAGTTWTRLGAGTALDHGVAGVIALPSGNLLVSPYAARGGGLQCSSDGGRTWAPRCP